MSDEANNAPEGNDENRSREVRQSAQNEAPHLKSSFVDDSEPIFSMYLEMADEEDKKMAEHWQANADGILIFTGLFSAAVASLISVSIQDIRPSSQDTTNFYLANIYQTLADPNQSNFSSSLPSSPPPFSPPTAAVWVNTLWFLSLVTGITCALLATLLQQWARRYLKVTQLHYSIAKRARIRAFFAEGVDKFVILYVAECLPTLLHVSLFLFFAGLVVFLHSVNFTIFKLVLTWICFCMALYGCVTLPPMLYLDCPYYTPFTVFFWQFAMVILDLFHQIRSTFSSPRRREELGKLRDYYHKLNLQGIHITAVEAALSPSLSWLDTRAFMWTFDSLAEDRELERFFSGLPGFRKSKEVVIDPLTSLTSEQKQKFSDALNWLLRVTFSTDFIPDSVKRQRAIVCAQAIDPAYIPDAFGVLHKILSEYQYSFPFSTADIISTVKGWGESTDESSVLDAQAALSTIVARVQPRDDSWFMLASDSLGVPEFALRGYAANDNNLSLAILIHITRQQLSNYGKPLWPSAKFSDIIEAASKFNVQDTSPKLRHDFCVLWNEIVLKVQNEDNRSMAFEILGPIRHTYLALHHNTDSGIVLTKLLPSTADKDDFLREPSSYPGCNVIGHIHNDPASVRTILHDIAAQTPDPAIAHVIQDCIDSTRTIPFPTPEPASLISLGPPPGVIATKCITDQHTSPDVQGVPSLPSPAPVLANMLPTESHLPGPAALHERNALDPPSVVWETVMAAPNLPLPPQSPPSSSVSNVASTGPLRGSLGTEHTGNQPLYPSHGRYDIV